MVACGSVLPLSGPGSVSWGGCNRMPQTRGLRATGIALPPSGGRKTIISVWAGLPSFEGAGGGSLPPLPASGAPGIPGRWPRWAGGCTPPASPSRVTWPLLCVRVCLLFCLLQRHRLRGAGLPGQPRMPPLALDPFCKDLYVRHDHTRGLWVGTSFRGHQSAYSRVF